MENTSVVRGREVAISPLPQSGACLTMTGSRRGGTNYHERFVFTPTDLSVHKHAAATEIVLRKVGDRIDVVELR